MLKERCESERAEGASGRGTDALRWKARGATERERGGGGGAALDILTTITLVVYSGWGQVPSPARMLESRNFLWRGPLPRYPPCPVQ